MKDLEKEYIHGDKFYAISDFIFSDMIKHDYNNLRGKSGIIFCKTDYISELFNHIRNSTSRYVLISHNSDYCVTNEMWNQKPECIKVWFAQNPVYNHPNLIPIPIGMERPLLFTPGGIRKGDNGDINVLKNIIPVDRLKKKSVLMAFNPHTNYKERYPLIERFGNVSWVTYIRDRIDFKSYINILKDYKYVLSPEGNGPDCIRTWEALYLDNVVPIVKRSVLTEYFRDLPILIVDNYSSLTLEYLNNAYEGVCKKNKEKATISYWHRFIKEKAGEVI